MRRGLPVERRHERLDSLPARDRGDDRALPDHRVALEIHLRDEPLREGVAEDGEVDVGRPPIVDAVRPRIGARSDGAEPVATLGIRDGPATAAEVRIERGPVTLLVVAVASARIGLPELDQHARQATSVLVEHAPVDDQALADGLAGLGEVGDEVVVARAQSIVPEHRPGHLGDRRLHRQQRALRRAQHRGLVLRRQGRRVPAAIALVERAVMRHRAFRHACTRPAGLRATSSSVARSRSYSPFSTDTASLWPRSCSRSR